MPSFDISRISVHRPSARAWHTVVGTLAKKNLSDLSSAADASKNTRVSLTARMKAYTPSVRGTSPDLGTRTRRKNSPPNLRNGVCWPHLPICKTTDWAFNLPLEFHHKAAGIQTKKQGLLVIEPMSVHANMRQQDLPVLEEYSLLHRTHSKNKSIPSVPGNLEGVI